ncbi:hypothetical protein PIB30_087707 [Stylosanthes scabra]|uniref:Uncharacterized protein n=1 Tax=Stylosanthes scabra TaxID=79078 RepID=A0ABU6ZS40_9FABA|nr:hypothetical protein [Stylosanthes scabra]
MENNARKFQEWDVRMDTQGLQPSQLPSSNSNTVSQEAERSSIHIHGLNKQPQAHHLHFPSAYGSSGGGATQGFIGMPKLEQQNTFNDPKRLPGGSVALLNNLASQQTPNAWQPPSNKDQNSGFLSSGSYVKKEPSPSDMPTEQQHRQNISTMHGLPSSNSAQIEQANANQGMVKDEFTRGVPASTSMAPTTSTSLTSLNSASLSGMAQIDPSVSLSSQVPSNTSGITARAPMKKPSVGQKKPLEALGSSPPPPSKKQKGSGDPLNKALTSLMMSPLKRKSSYFQGPRRIIEFQKKLEELCKKRRKADFAENFPPEKIV